jgi:hypothetical protein
MPGNIAPKGNASLSLKRRRKTAKIAEPKRSGPGMLGLFLAIFLFALLGFFWRDANGLRLGILGSYLWVVALFLALFAGALYFAQFILPLRGEIGWFEGLRLIFNTLFVNFPLLPRPMGAQLPPDSEPISSSFKLLGRGIVESHHALALARGPSFTRAAGPGFVRLNRWEYVSHLVDLRPQRRKLPVKAITGDGIPVDTSVAVMFQIRHNPNEPGHGDIPYPYDSDAIFQSCYSGSIGAQENPVSWGERLARQAAADLVTALSHRTLDQLFQADDPASDPLLQLEDELRDQLNITFAAAGFRVITISISPLDLPPDVMNEQINNWQANWQHRILVEKAGGDAEAIRRIKLARARAQLEMIENITRNIEAMHQAGHTNLTEVITLRMIEAMEQAAADNTVQAMVPQQMMSTLAQMHRWIERKE